MGAFFLRSASKRNMRIFFGRNCLLFLCSSGLTVFVVLIFVYLNDQADIPNELEDFSNFEFEGRAQADPHLIAFIRHQIQFPPEKLLPYNLEHPEKKDFSVNGQGIRLRNLFGEKTNGFFVEAGAFKGEYYSPTLFFERELNWTGLLIEPILDFFQILSQKNRRASTLHAGVSPTTNAGTSTYQKEGYASKIIDFFSNQSDRSPSYLSVPSFPLTSILAALGNPTVHLLSLDVESVELRVLRTMDLKNLDIHVIMVEYQLLPEGYEALREHMEINGYRMYAKLHQDAIFVKKGVRF